jgi:tRNA(Ile)-lysidine synthase TilS/MesJ
MKKFLKFTGATAFPSKNSVNSLFLGHKKTFFYLTTDFLEKCSNLVKNQMSFLCTLSGGQDSILTFFLLFHSFKKDYLQIVYCHHFWQIKNFFSTRFVFQISSLMKVPYTLILPQTFFLTENESRTWRKKNFCRVSQREHFLTSLTGQTETDTLEKRLHNLFRGTSPAGLSDLNFLKCKNKVVFFFQV